MPPPPEQATRNDSSVTEICNRRVYLELSHPGCSTEESHEHYLETMIHDVVQKFQAAPLGG